MTAATGQIDPDVLAIAGVVLGTDPVPLDPDARAIALQAMNALGYSTPYMSEVLGVHARSIPGLAGRLRVPLDRGREFVDQLAVDLVLQGAPMALRGNDLAAALAQLAAAGKTVSQCARLLRTTPTAVRNRAAALQLTLPEDSAQDCWWHRYYYTDPKDSSCPKN